MIEKKHIDEAVTLIQSGQVLNGEDWFNLIYGKHCKRCKVYKPPQDFYVLKSRRLGKPDGKSIYCKSCWKEINAENKLRRKLNGK